MRSHLATLMLLGLKTGVVLTVFVLGLSASPQDATYLFHRPRQLLKSLLAMNVVMPLFTAAVVAIFELHPDVELALIALAVSPIPPMLPKKTLKTRVDMSYPIGLLVAAAVFGIVFVPLAVNLLGGRALGVPMQMSPMAVARVVAITVLAPLAGGLIVRRITPAFAMRIAKPISRMASVLLIISLLPILFTAMPAMVSLIGNGTLAAVVAFVAVGLAVGHILGGPEPAGRTVLALTTASRHPGVAAAIATSNFPQQKLVLPAILLYLLVNAIMSIPYLVWRRRKHTKMANAVDVKAA